MIALLWLSAKMAWLTSGISRLLFISRRIAKWSLKILFPVPPRDFDSIVDDLLEEASANGVRASDWQNHSINFTGMNIYLMPEFHRIACPVMFIQGDKDVAVKPEYTAEAVNRIPEAKLIMLENHGHWPNRQSPEKVNRIILDFLDS